MHICISYLRTTRLWTDVWVISFHISTKLYIFTYIHTYIFQICVLCLFGCVFQTAWRLQNGCLKRLSSLPGELSVILNNCLGRVWLWEWACSFVCPSVHLSATLFCDSSACPDKPSRRLISNLVDTFIMVLFKSHNFWSCCTEFAPFPGLSLLEQFLFICRQTTDRIYFKFGVQTHYPSHLAWLNFGHALLNYHRLLAFGFSSNFCALANKALIRFSSNLVDQFIMGLPQPD